MSFFDVFHNNPLIVGCTLIATGFGVGFGVNEVLSNNVRQVESVETSRLSNDVETLQQQVLSKDDTIHDLTGQLNQAHQDLISLRNNLGSTNFSSQVSNQKCSDLSQRYSQLSGMYSELQAKYVRAERNCSTFSRIGDLEQKRNRLEIELNGLKYDVFDKNVDERRKGLQMLLEQNNQQLMSLQQQLSR